jgi:hypothetical protein
MAPLEPKRARVYGFGFLALALLLPAGYWRKLNAESLEEAHTNFKLGYDLPTGWKELPHSPQTLFFCEDPKTKVKLRGAVNQVVADYNPTPELDRDGLTQQFADITTDHLGWKATILDTVSFDGGSYRLIRRETTDRIVVSAIAVRGNTTVLMGISGIGEAKKQVDGQIPFFKRYLATTSLEKTIID